GSPARVGRLRRRIVMGRALLVVALLFVLADPLTHRAAADGERARLAIAEVLVENLGVNAQPSVGLTNVLKREVETSWIYQPVPTSVDLKRLLDRHRDELAAGLLVPGDVKDIPRKGLLADVALLPVATRAGGKWVLSATVSDLGTFRQLKVVTFE